MNRRDSRPARARVRRLFHAAGRLMAAYPQLRIDNTDRAPEDVATEVLAWLAGSPG